MYGSIDTAIIASFLFIFAIVFAVFNMSGVFGKNKNTNIIISLIFAFFAMQYQPYVELIPKFLPMLSILFIALFGLFFVNKIREKNKLDDNSFLGIIFVLFLVFIATYGEYNLFPQYGEDVLWVVGFVFMGLLFYLGYGKNNDQQNTARS